MADLKAFEAALREEHAALTTAFETAQPLAEAAWADAEAKAAKLTAFRAKYGHVLRALDQGAVREKGDK